MAGKKKKDKNVEVAQEESNGSKLLTILIVIAIVLIWLGIFGVLIKMDVGNFGSEVLAPVIKDVPVINRILPKSEEDTQTLAYTNIDEANAKIKQLEDEVSQLKKEVERLKKFEEQQKSFEQRVKTFDENVVYNDQAPDISEYKKYYEEIDPDNAASIYKDVSKDLIYSDKITKQATMYGKMDPEKAAAVLETMTGDLDLVASILDSMSESKSSAILAEMTPETAAQITTKMTAK